VRELVQLKRHAAFNVEARGRLPRLHMQQQRCVLFLNACTHE
jgi:hypothetical protein